MKNPHTSLKSEENFHASKKQEYLHARYIDAGGDWLNDDSKMVVLGRGVRAITELDAGIDIEIRGS